MFTIQNTPSVAVSKLEETKRIDSEVDGREQLDLAEHNYNHQRASLASIYFPLPYAQRRRDHGAINNQN